MAIDFPASPSVNDIHTSGGKRWTWNGTSWERSGTPGPGDTISATNDNTTSTVYPVLVTGTGSNTAKIATTSSKSVSFNASNGTLTATSFTGTLNTAAQTNITSVGTLGSLNVTGVTTISGITTYSNSVHFGGDQVTWYGGIPDRFMRWESPGSHGILRLSDLTNLYFGDGSNTHVYHQGNAATHSTVWKQYLDYATHGDSGSNPLIFYSKDVQIKGSPDSPSSGQNDSIADFHLYEGVKLYYNDTSSSNGLKFETTSSGVNIVGTTTTGQLNVTGNATIGGVLTYEDVKNVDAVGLVTARNGIKDQTLTAGRVVYVDSDKTLTDSANLTFNGSDLLIDAATNAYKGVKFDNSFNLTFGSSSGTSPRLYLKGTSNSQSDAGDTFLATGSGGEQIFRSNTFTKFEVNADSTTAEALRITSAGKVGIGSAVPAYNLDISGSGTQQLAVQSTGAADAVIRLNNSVLSWDFDNDGNGTVESGAAGTLHLRNSSLGDAAVMSFTAAGNIGISTSVPNTTQDLTIDGASNYKAGIFYKQAGVNQYRFMCEGGTGHVYYDTFVNDRDHIFRVDSQSTGGTEVFRICGDKKIGINTSSPARMMHIFSGTTGHPVVLERGDTSNTQIELRTGGATRGYWGCSTTANFLVYDNDTSDIHFTVNQTGKVGLGIVTPTAGDLASGASFAAPKFHILGDNSQSGAYELLARFGSGTDADNSGATIVLNHANDRGLAIQGGRSVGNRGYGALKSIDNLGRLSDAIEIRGGNGQGVAHLAFYTGEATTTTQRLHITSSGNVVVGDFTPVDTRNDGGIHIRDNKGISFKSHSSSSSRNWRIRNDDSAWGNLDFGVGTSNSDFADVAAETVLSLASSRRVGINEVSPDRTLHISDASNGGVIRLTNTLTSINNGTICGMIEFEQRDGADGSGNAGVSANIRAEMTDSTNGANQLCFSTGTPSTIGTRMTLSHQGRLSLSGPSSQQLNITGTEADIWLTSSGPSTTWRILGSTGTNTHRFRIYDETHGRDVLNIYGENTSNETRVGNSDVHINYGLMIGKNRTRYSTAYGCNDVYAPVVSGGEGECVFSIDPSWSQSELRKFFNTDSVSWLNIGDAPGGYAIMVSGAVNCGGDYGSGFPYIPIDDGDSFRMECWMRTHNGSQNHYMGSIEYDCNMENGTGNPGSYGYWAMVNQTINSTSWTRVTGTIGPNHGSSYGEFRSGFTGGARKYWTPQALFNYVNNSGDRICYISGWRVFRLRHRGTHVFEGLNVTGSKTFQIPHPLTSKKDTHELVHSSVESPQCDNIYRGKITLSSGTATVNLDNNSNMTDGTFVVLNTNIQCHTSNETGWGAVKGSVSGNILTITAQDNTSTDTISWIVVGERKDEQIKSDDRTNDDGELIVEFPKVQNVPEGGDIPMVAPVGIGTTS